MYYMLKIKYISPKVKHLVQDILIYSSLEDLNADLDEFKSLSDVKDYKIYSCFETNVETGELLDKD